MDRGAGECFIDKTTRTWKLSLFGKKGKWDFFNAEVKKRKTQDFLKENAFPGY